MLSEAIAVPDGVSARSQASVRKIHLSSGSVAGPITSNGLVRLCQPELKEVKKASSALRREREEEERKKETERRRRELGVRSGVGERVTVRSPL